MEILTNVILPFALALLIAIPGIAGIWHFSSQRDKRRAETASSIVATALTLLEPLEDRVKDQDLIIEAQQKSINKLKAENATANALITKQAKQLQNLAFEVAQLKERPNGRAEGRS